MLRRTVLALAAAFFCSAVFQPSMAEAAKQAEVSSKIGAANVVHILSQSDPAKERDTQLQNMFGKERQQLEKQNAELSKQAESLEKQAAALSEKARNERVQKIRKQAKEFEDKRAEYSKRLARVQQSINAQIEDVLRTACGNYAQKNNYDMIVDASVVMFFHKSHNVTTGLIEEVNKVWKSRGGKFKIDTQK